jgi:SpoVK/Ycf46/Vps4 family AAA+-type ATPase
MIEGDLHKLLEDLAVKTNGWSGDDIRQLIDDAKERPLLEAIKGKNHRKLTTEDFEYALSKRQPSVNPWFIEAIKACKRYNEEKLLKDILKHTPSFMEIKNDEL